MTKKSHSESEEKKDDESQNGEGTEEKNSDASRKPGKSDDEKKKNDKSSGDEKKKSRRPSKKAFIIGAIVLAILIILGVLYYLHSRHFVSTDDSHTAGHIHQISARVAGTFMQVPVDDNEVVVKDQPLALLDPSSYQLILEKAKAQMAQAQAQVTQARDAAADRDAAIQRKRKATTTA